MQPDFAFLKMAGDYSPTKSSRIACASPVLTSAACLGTHWQAPVLGFFHLSCFLPCLTRTHPAFLIIFNSSDVFIIQRTLWLICHCKGSEKVTNKQAFPRKTYLFSSLSPRILQELTPSGDKFFHVRRCSGPTHLIADSSFQCEVNKSKCLQTCTNQQIWQTTLCAVL